MSEKIKPRMKTYANYANDHESENAELNSRSFAEFA